MSRSGKRTCHSDANAIDDGFVVINGLPSLFSRRRPSFAGHEVWRPHLKRESTLCPYLGASTSILFPAPSPQRTLPALEQYCFCCAYDFFYRSVRVQTSDDGILAEWRTSCLHADLARALRRGRAGALALCTFDELDTDRKRVSVSVHID